MFFSCTGEKAPASDHQCILASELPAPRACMIKNRCYVVVEEHQCRCWCSSTTTLPNGETSRKESPEWNGVERRTTRVLPNHLLICGVSSAERKTMRIVLWMLVTPYGQYEKPASEIEFGTHTDVKKEKTERTREVDGERAHAVRVVVGDGMVYVHTHMPPPRNTCTCTPTSSTHQVVRGEETGTHTGDVRDTCFPKLVVPYSSESVATPGARLGGCGRACSPSVSLTYTSLCSSLYPSEGCFPAYTRNVCYINLL